MSLSSNQLKILLDTSVSEDGGSRSDFYQLAFQFANGTVDNLADLSYGNKRTITSSGSPDQVDLAGGNVYIGRSSTPLTFVEVTTLLVVNIDTVQQLTVGGSGNTFSTIFTGTNPGIILPPAYTVNSIVYPSLCLLHCSKNPAYAVTAGSADILQVMTNGGSNIQYLLFLLGRSA